MFPLAKTNVIPHYTTISQTYQNQISPTSTMKHILRKNGTTNSSHNSLPLININQASPAVTVTAICYNLALQAMSREFAHTSYALHCILLFHGSRIVDRWHYSQNHFPAKIVTP